MEYKKIRWAPKVRPEKIRDLYETEKTGLLEDDQVDDVGIALLLRCRSIVMVNRREVECPECGTIFPLAAEDADGSDGIIRCPGDGCTWRTTLESYRLSWRHRELNGANALPCFFEFIEKYPKLKTKNEKMILIDQLIHSFHWDLKANMPNRSAANNLIEGSHDQVIALLDGITYGDPEKKEEWRRTASLMQKRRHGKLLPDH